MLMMLAAFAEMGKGGLRGEEKTEDVNVECLVKLFFGEGRDWRKLVDAGVVDQNVEAAEVLDGSVDDALSLSGLGYVSTDGDGLAAGTVMALTTASAPALLEK